MARKAEKVDPETLVSVVPELCRATKFFMERVRPGVTLYQFDKFMDAAFADRLDGAMREFRGKLHPAEAGEIRHMAHTCLALMYPQSSIAREFLASSCKHYMDMGPQAIRDLDDVQMAAMVTAAPKRWLQWKPVTMLSRSALFKFYRSATGKDDGPGTTDHSGKDSKVESDTSRT